LIWGWWKMTDPNPRLDHRYAGITNDQSTWLVDWTQPIEWHDGTPAEVYGDAWSGQIHVLLDPENLPEGFKASGLRRVADVRRGTMICTNVIAAYGTPADGSCKCRIINVSDRLARETMLSSPTWGTF